VARILVTGGSGFIGSNFVREALAQGHEIINLDKLTYAGNPENLEDIAETASYRFMHGDIADQTVVRQAMDGVDWVVNFAAESHVDRSIDDPSPFITTNVLGTQVLLHAAHQLGVKRFLQVSTDEVYGSLGAKGAFDEQSPIEPNSPYAASKAAADLLVRSYVKTFGLDAIITRCSNNYGPFQFPEKLIPLMITNALEGLSLPVYGDGSNVRDWIHVDDHCRALLRVLEEGTAGEVYNIGGRGEASNLEVVRRILSILGVSEDKIEFVKDRPGHDFRYAIDCSKLERGLEWTPKVDFKEGLAATVAWYRDHQLWWERIRSGAYREYYDKMYGDRGSVGDGASR